MPIEKFSERVERSTTSVTKLVFPNNTNHNQTLFGGTAMAWVDEVGFIAATRFTRQKVVTVSMDRIDFKIPIPAGSIVELIAKVVQIGNTSLTVRVKLFKESMHDEGRELALTGELVFVAVDDEMRPMALSHHHPDN